MKTLRVSILLVTALGALSGCEPAGGDENASTSRHDNAVQKKEQALSFPGPGDLGSISIPIDPLVTTMSSFAPYDMNRDSTHEIESINLLPFEDPSQATPQDARLVLVIVEPRLLDTIAGSVADTDDVLEALERYKSDLSAEGLHSRFIEISVYDGQTHQDGLTVLAIRELLKGVRDEYSGLEGVVLVGSFPEAMLVRRTIWRKDIGADDSVTIQGTEHQGVSHLRIVPEIIAERAEIVLGDLDGNWRNLYRQSPTDLESIVAIPNGATKETQGENWPKEGLFESDIYERTTVEFEDFFWIQDDDYTNAQISDNVLSFFITSTSCRHPELSPNDRALPNPIARPDILVSRINPRNVAVNPDTAFLDAGGHPQAVQSASPIALSPEAFFHRDSELERQVLLDYFSRNHTYRRGGFSNLGARVSSISGSNHAAGAAASLSQELAPASSNLDAGSNKDNATLVEYVEWFKEPAVLRGVYAHSTPQYSAYVDTYDVRDLESAVGDHWWRWRRSGSWYLPSLDQQGRAANLYLHRSVWENGALDGTGANLFVHLGCQANSPAGASKLPYNDPAYGTFQNAEGLLFYMNGLAIMTRAKIFNDWPAGFGDEIGESERNGFGLGWRGYFEHDANDSGLEDKNVSSKKTYPWSVVGDWTVRVDYENGIAALGLDRTEIVDKAVSAHNTWIGDWNLEADSDIVAKGDFDGDGDEDLLATNPSGIGILSVDSTGGFKAAFFAPNGTEFGDWKFDSNSNTIEGTGDFDGDRQDEIVVTSPWGIGILDLDGDARTAPVIKPNGTRFGWWPYDSRTDTIEGIGDFDGDGRAELLITNSSGIGILKKSGSSLSSPVVQPNGARFGGWLYDSTKNRIAGIGDFDRDGKDDIVVTSSWGIGILEKYASTLTGLVVQPNGSRFGDWLYDSTKNHIAGIADFDGDGDSDILVTSSWGIGILKKYGRTLRSIVAKPNWSRFGSWTYHSAYNKIEGIGDFDGDGSADIFISNVGRTGLLKRTGSSLWSIDVDNYGTTLGNWHSEGRDKYSFVGDFDGAPGDEIVVEK